MTLTKVYIPFYLIYPSVLLHLSLIMSYKNQSSVTLLHKGQGPSLFQYHSRPLVVPQETPRSPYRKAGAPPPKRVVVKCVDTNQANSMFAKRLRARTANHYRPSTSTPSTSTTANKPKSPAEQQQCNMYVRERLFTNIPHKPAPFPPPSFMPRWNPRQKDRTYLSKMVLEDPWSLPPEKRAELKKKTGLRLKSLSRHYQYKVGANLPFGKDVASGCNCYVNFCEHCSKPHSDYRCPLHMQLLDAFEPDCKTELGEFCPFSKNVEDLPLDQIKDPGVYVSEVVRRLRAGEILKAPPFPSRFLLDDRLLKESVAQRNIPASSEASAETLDHPDIKKVIREDSCTQTEPFIVDVDMKAAFKENICQTRPPDKEEPMMINNLSKALQNQSHYTPYPRHITVATQVTPCAIQSFNQRSAGIVKKIATMTIGQSLQEISNELRLQEIEKFRAQYTQKLVSLHRTTQFKFLQEKWRNSAYMDEQYQLDRELFEEKSAEQAVCAVSFSMSCFWNFLGKGMDSLRRAGFIVNEDLRAMNTVVRDEMNRLMEERLRKRDESIKLLDEMINHAVLDLEMDAFRGKLVDEKYLDPLSLTTRFLRDLIVLRDNNFEVIRRIQRRLFDEGCYINHNGELVCSSSTSSSEVSLDAFLEGIRVSLDSEGNPKYLVDRKGKTLPINVRWMKILEEQVEQHVRSDSGWRFDIVLDEKSLSDTKLSEEGGGTHAVPQGERRLKKGGSGRVSNERGSKPYYEEEGLGLDMGYIAGENKEDSDDDEEGRLVFKRRTGNYMEEDEREWEDDGVNN